MDLGAEFEVSQMKVTSRAHGTGYIYPGELKLSTMKGPKSTAGRCAQWTFGGTNEIEYVLDLAGADEATSPSLEPTPSPSLSYAPTTASPFLSDVSGPTEQSESVFFEGTETSYLEIPTPFSATGSADFALNFWFRCFSEPASSYAWKWNSKTLEANEGVQLVEMSDDPFGFGVRLTSNSGVSFGILESNDDAISEIDSILRSHQGIGKGTDHLFPFMA